MVALEQSHHNSSMKTRVARWFHHPHCRGTRFEISFFVRVCTVCRTKFERQNERRRPLVYVTLLGSEPLRTAILFNNAVYSFVVSYRPCIGLVCVNTMSLLRACTWEWIHIPGAPHGVVCPHTCLVYYSSTIRRNVIVVQGSHHRSSFFSFLMNEAVQR